METAILEKLSARDPKGDAGKSIDPSEVAKDLQPERWQRTMPKIRAVALGLMRQGRLTITKKGKAVDPDGFKGVIRLRLPTADETAAAHAARPPVQDDAD